MTKDRKWMIGIGIFFAVLIVIQREQTYQIAVAAYDFVLKAAVLTPAILLTVLWYVVPILLIGFAAMLVLNGLKRWWRQ